MEKNDRHIRSEEVQDILEATPGWMVRWGMIVIGIFLIVGLAFTAIIKFPEVINGQAIITTENPPIKIVNPFSGIVEKVYASNNQFVNEGDVLFEIKNTLEKNDFYELKRVVNKITITSDNSAIISEMQAMHSRTLGELQVPFNQLVIGLDKLNVIRKNEYEANKIKLIKHQIEHHRRLATAINSQVKLKAKDVENATKDFEISLSLYRQQVITQIQLFDEEKKYNQQIQDRETLTRDFYQNEITIRQLEKEKLDLEQQNFQNVKYLASECESALSELKNSIDEYELKRLIKAPCSGVVDYSLILSSNQFIREGAEVLTIIPKETAIVCVAQVPTQSFSKVREGQKVIISLENYPELEFGQLIGRVETFSRTHNQSTYRIMVSLPKNLFTTYHQKLEYLPEMKGHVQVITKDVSLMQRMFNHVNDLLTND
jgi:multidrug resistance efflux pump